MLAVEVLLADPEALGDDVLESSLYLLRERLRSACAAKTLRPISRDRRSAGRPRFCRGAKAPGLDPGPSCSAGGASGA
jgi:hypothetical protein